MNEEQLTVRIFELEEMVTVLKAERDEQANYVSTLLARVDQITKAELNGLREALRLAEIMRDSARAASQRYLDEKRAVVEKIAAWLSERDHINEETPQTLARLIRDNAW